MIERSKAIKCPSIQHHLAGAKKIQQELSKANILEKFLDKSEAKLLRATFVDQYSFDFIDVNKLNFIASFSFWKFMII